MKNSFCFSSLRSEPGLPTARQRHGLRQSSGAFRTIAAFKAPEDLRSPKPLSIPRGAWVGLLLLLIVLVTFSPAGAAESGNIPDRPEKLTFPQLDYEPPSPAEYRVQLKSGPVAYVVPDRELPLVTVNVLVRVGSYLEPEGKTGLASLTGQLLSRGGAGDKTAEQLEERLAFLAAQLASGISDSQGNVNLNLLSKDLEEGLQILRNVLTAPRFQEDRLELSKQQTLQAMQKRNDDSALIEQRERAFLAFGENFWATRQSTSNSIHHLTRQDLQNFHQRWFHPSNFVVACSGDFDRPAMIGRLEKLFSSWPFPGTKPEPIPTNTAFASPGIYVVDKKVNQGRVSMLLPGILREDPDYFAVMVMNDILGGGGFTSRVMSRVRSDEGLAYAAGTSFHGGIYYPLTFNAGFQSKSRTVPYAVSIVREEIARIAKQAVEEQELQTSRQGFLERFPRTFATKSQVANTFAQDEFTGLYARQPDYWKNYRKKTEDVNEKEIQRVARKFFNLDQLVILIVGEKEEILKGHPDHPVSVETLAKGKIIDLPLRDPMTMKPIR